MFRIARALPWLCLAVLVGCGGGSSDASDAGNFAAVFDHPSVDAQGIEGSPQPVPLTANITLTGAAAAQGVYLRAGADHQVLLDVKGQLLGSQLQVTLTLRGDLAPGDYTGDFLLYACYDEACTRSPAGSPVRLPIRYHVKPNLQVQQQVVLSRQGADAAPQVTLPVSIPAEAGAVTMTSSSSWPEAIGVSFDGSALRVTTQQVPAGTYRATVTLQSPNDIRYSRTVEVQYSVTAPTGGEHPLSVDEPYRNVSIRQGDAATYRIVVTRPTWSSDFGEPEFFWNTGGMLSLTPLGGGQYDVLISTSGLPMGQYTPTVRFSAGTTGGVAFATFNVSVYSSFYVDGGQGHTLTATSTANDLNWSHPIRMFDGSSVTWTAVSQSPLLHVVNSSGQTGLDELQLKLDPAALNLPDWGRVFPVVVSVDRPGVLPLTTQLSVSNFIPTLQMASPSTLVGSSGRVYIQGAFRYFDGDPLGSNRLRVEGATLSHGQLIADRRYLSDFLVLALDLTGATSGQPVRVYVDSDLLPTQLELQVQAPLRANMGYQALSYGSYRPGQFAPGLGGFYFSAPGTAYRWAPGPSGWSLSQASVPGLIDLAPSSDESQLFALRASEVMALHPLTFAQQSASAPTGGHYPSPITFDTAAAGSRALVFSADGRALASMGDLSNPETHTIGTLCTQQATRAVPSLTDAPESCDPGTAKGWVNGPTGSGAVRSANGAIVVGVNPNGQRSSYRADDRQWVSAAPLPDGLMVRAVSDSGSRMVRSDGMVIDTNGAPLGSLAGAVPFTHVAAGYGLSSGGRFGLVYGYRVTGTTGAQRATDATLWVLDLNNAATTGVGSAPLLTAIALPDAVGCTSAFAPGETCEHQAWISVAPGDGTAFLVGPRGVAAVPLPTSVTSAQPLSTPRRSRANAASAAPVQHPVDLPLRGHLKVD